MEDRNRTADFDREARGEREGCGSKRGSGSVKIALPPFHLFWCENQETQTRGPEVSPYLWVQQPKREDSLLLPYRFSAVTSPTGASRSPRPSRFKIRCSVSVLHPQLVADRQDRKSTR